MPNITTKTEQETRLLARKLGSAFKGGEIVALRGNLGSGKTTFVKGLARALGVKHKIQSPTFVICQVYPAKTQLKFYHFDLYRLKSAAEFRELGITEILRNRHNVVAVEWPGKLGKLLPTRTIYIEFKHDKKYSNLRHITIRD